MHISIHLILLRWPFRLSRRCCLSRATYSYCMHFSVLLTNHGPYSFSLFNITGTLAVSLYVRRCGHDHHWFCSCPPLRVSPICFLVVHLALLRVPSPGIFTSSTLSGVGVHNALSWDFLFVSISFSEAPCLGFLSLA